MNNASVPAHPVKSALCCASIIIPVIALIYLSFNSQEFRDGACIAIADFWLMVCRVVEAGSKLPPLIQYALFGSFYWAQCVIFKLTRNQGSVKVIRGLFIFQIVVFALSFVMAIPYLYGTSMPVLVGVVAFIHFIAGVCLIEFNVETISKIVVTPEEATEAAESEQYY